MRLPAHDKRFKQGTAGLENGERHERQRRGYTATVVFQEGGLNQEGSVNDVEVRW